MEFSCGLAVKEQGWRLDYQFVTDPLTSSLEALRPPAAGCAIQRSLPVLLEHRWEVK